MRCFKCAYLYIDLSKKNQIKPINYKYPTCFCKCDFLDKPLSSISKEDLERCHYREKGKKYELFK